MANRFTRNRIYAQFNPLSLQELSVLPVAKQQQHDASLAGAQSQLMNVNSLSQDVEAARAIEQEVEGKVNEYSQNLMRYGVQPNSAKGLIDLQGFRTEKQKEADKIQSQLAAYQAYKESMDKRLEQWYKGGEGGIDPDTYNYAMELSMGRYKGYKESNFSGHDPAAFADVPKTLTEYAKDLDLNQIKESTGWQLAQNYKGSGQDVWLKGTVTRKTPPAEVRALIKNRMVSDPRIMAKMRDEVLYKTELGLWNDSDKERLKASVNSMPGVSEFLKANNLEPEELIDPKSPHYNKDIANQLASKSIESKYDSYIESAVGIATSGQEYSYDEDIRTISKGGSEDGNKNSPFGDIVSDPYNTPMYYNVEDGLEGVRESIDELKESDPAAAANMERWINQQQSSFDRSPEGQRLLAEKNKWVNNLSEETGIPKEIVEKIGTKSKFSSGSEGVLGEPKIVYTGKNGRLLTRKEFAKENQNLTAAELHKALEKQKRYKYEWSPLTFDARQRNELQTKVQGAINSSKPEYFESLDKIIRGGQMSEARIYTVGGDRIKDMNENKALLNSVISPALYEVVGTENNNEDISEITNGKIESMGYVSYGDMSRPVVKVTYTPAGEDVPVTKHLNVKDLNNSEIKNSFQHGLTNAFRNEALVNKFESEITEFGKVDYTSTFKDLSRSLGNKEIKIEKQYANNTPQFYVSIGGKAFSWEDLYAKFDENGDKIISEFKEKSPGTLSEPVSYNDKYLLLKFLKDLNNSQRG